MNKLGFKRRPATAADSRRRGGYGRRSVVERLEPRELLTAEPWQGNTLAIGDFDGDGNPDRLSDMSANGNALNELWAVDTKASSSAGNTESWRVTRGDGSPPGLSLPTQMQVRVADFNGDGRDDILGRGNTGPWYMIQSRGPITVETTAYAGEFYISLWGGSGMLAGPNHLVAGDYNGDGRDDLAMFDASDANNKKWLVARSNGTRFEPDEAWATSTFVPDVNTLDSGDFNGDGRDDLTYKQLGTNNWVIAVSDGARFNISTMVLPASSTAWPKRYIGDFDGDGADELLGWNNNQGRWDLFDYDDHRGMTLETTWGLALGGDPTLLPIHVGDVNRDGRDDLVAYDTDGADHWTVALSQKQSNGTDAFVVQNPSMSNREGHWDHWFEDWDWGPTGHEFVAIDDAYQTLIDKFSSVYNTIELEYYPGLMKGPAATLETKAGNDWDQAALLNHLLRESGEPNYDSFINTGKVRATQSEVVAWLGAKDPGSAYEILKQAFDPNAGQNDGTFTFLHTLVMVLMPDATGLNYCYIDPSWKFRNLPESGSFESGSGLIESFDEFAKDFLFTTIDGKFVKSQLPIEAYEDKVMTKLGASSIRGKSLADVPYDGPIIARDFDQLPLTPVASLGGSDRGYIPVGQDQFQTLNAVVNVPEEAEKWTHRVRIKISSTEASEVIEQTVVVPKVSLDSIKIGYTTIGTTSGYVRPQLTILGQIFTFSSPNQVSLGSEPTIEITHLDPDRFGDISGYGAELKKDTYERKAGDHFVVSLDANQYSNDRLLQMRASLNTAMATIAEADISELLAYTGAKYWHDYNRDLRTLTGLTHTIDIQQRVGSGLITAERTFDVQPHLPLPLVPDGMFVDLKNAVFNPGPLGVPTSSMTDVTRFGILNASALESAILEEVINAESISTVKGIQLFLDSASGTLASEKVLVIERQPGQSGYRVVAQYNRHGQQELSSPLNWTNAAQVKDNLFLEASAEDAIIDVLETANATNRIWVPTGTTSIAGPPGWDGAVYISDVSGNGKLVLKYIIQPLGGEATNGAYRYGVVAPPKPELPPATFLNQTHAGDPVNVANGNMFRDEVDFKFANPGLPLDFARHYDSQNNMGVGFGIGWVHNFTGIVYKELDPANTNYNKFVWLRGNGERHVFEDHNFEPPNTLFGETSVSAPFADGVRRLTEYRDKDGTKYKFEGIITPFTTSGTKGNTVFSRLKSIENATGDARLDITYGGPNSANVFRVTPNSAVGRYLEFTNSVAGPNNTLSHQVKRFEGNKEVDAWTYIRRTDFTGPGSNGNRLIEVHHANDNSIVTKYDYHTTGPHAQKGLMSKITEPNGERHEYEYYANGRVFRVTDGEGKQQSFSYNLFRNLTEFTDERGNVETYIHQDNGLLTKQIHNDRSRLEFAWGMEDSVEEFLMKSSTDELGSTEKFTYFAPTDVHNRLGELKESVAKDGLVTNYEYWTSSNPNNRYISGLSKIIVDPGHSNITTEYARDAFGRLTEEKDAEGNGTKYEYFGTSSLAHLLGLRKSET